jgi:hypothetical protein
MYKIKKIYRKKEKRRGKRWKERKTMRGKEKTNERTKGGNLTTTLSKN